MGEIRFSVVIPAFNVAPYIEDCIQSVLNQTCQDFEVIVIDDYSTDSTVDVVEQFGDDRLRLIRNPSNRGVSHSRNVGIAEARGEYIVLLDSDDAFDLNRLEVLGRYLEKEQPDLIFDDLRYVKDGHEATGLTAFSKRQIAATEVSHLGYAEFVSRDLGILKGAIRKSFLTEHSIAYADGYNLGEDFLFYSEVFLNGGKVTFIPDALYLYRQRESSLATSVSDQYYEGFMATTRLILGRYESVLRSSPYKSLLLTRMRRQTSALSYYQATTKLKSRDFSGTLAHLAKDPRIGLRLASEALTRLIA